MLGLPPTNSLAIRRQHWVNYEPQQGWFQVENRDGATPERKTVRVVVDVNYEVK
jgi:hypothetical protein